MLLSGWVRGKVAGLVESEQSSIVKSLSTNGLVSEGISDFEESIRSAVNTHSNATSFEYASSVNSVVRPPSLFGSAHVWIRSRV